MTWYDDLQRQVEKCAGGENAQLMSELLAEIGVEAMIAGNERYYLQRLLRNSIVDSQRRRLSLHRFCSANPAWPQRSSRPVLQSGSK